MFTRQKTKDGADTDFGLGWTLTSHRGEDEVWRDGRTHGVSSIIYMIPGRKFVVAVAANLEGVELLDLARSLAEIAAPHR